MECFPGDTYDDSAMRAFVGELIRVGLLVEYEHENEAFWQVTGWKHQRIDKPNYRWGPLDFSGHPVPVSDHSTTIRRPFDDHSPPEGNGRESKGMEGSGVDVCAVVEESTTTPAPAKPSGHAFVVADGSEWDLSQSKLDEYRKSFPELDLDREFRRAAQWLRDNPRRRKTRRGMYAFLGSWLTRAQDRGASCGSSVGVIKTFHQQKIENSERAIQEFLSDESIR
jgi:hypothetical protein